MTTYADQAPLSPAIAQAYGRKRLASVSRRIFWLASMPAVAIWATPYGRISIGPGYVYFHDATIIIFLLYSILFRADKNRHPLFTMAIGLYFLSFIIGLASSLYNWGASDKLFFYAGEYLLYILYARRVYDFVKLGLIRPEQMASVIAVSAAISASLGITQYLLTYYYPEKAGEYINYYYRLFDIYHDYEEGMERWRAGKIMFRVTGPWLVSTTFGGILVLAMPLLLFSTLKPGPKIVSATIIVLAILLTGTRHAWLGLMALFLAMLFGGKIKLGRRLKQVTAGVVILAIVYVFSSAFRTSAGAITSFDAIISGRIQRTLELGVTDQSLTARFIAGPHRFVKAMINRPHMFVFGAGYAGAYSFVNINNPYSRSSAKFGALSGFISNSLLLNQNCNGIVGFIAILVLHFYPLRKRHRNQDVINILLVSFIVMNGDNYAFYLTRAFMVSILTIAFAWMVMDSGRQYQPPQLTKSPRTE